MSKRWEVESLKRRWVRWGAEPIGWRRIVTFSTPTPPAPSSALAASRGNCASTTEAAIVSGASVVVESSSGIRSFGESDIFVCVCVCVEKGSQEARGLFEEDGTIFVEKSRMEKWGNGGDNGKCSGSTAVPRE